MRACIFEQIDRNYDTNKTPHICMILCFVLCICIHMIGALTSVHFNTYNSGHIRATVVSFCFLNHDR